MELKSCPFCGGEAKMKNVGVELGDPEYAICCDKCWIQGPSHPHKEPAINLWNTRAAQPEKEKEGK